MITIKQITRNSLLGLSILGVAYGAISTPVYAQGHKKPNASGEHKQAQQAGAQGQKKQQRKTKNNSNGTSPDGGSSSASGGNGQSQSTFGSRQRKQQQEKRALGSIGPGEHTPNTDGERLAPRERFANRFDQDGDGVVSVAEVQAATLNKFGQLDSDGDGNVSNAELEAVNSITATDQTNNLFIAEDNNADGLISTTEAYQLVNRLVAQGADSDGDGQISSSELTLHFTLGQTDQQLELLDTNADGVISITEYSTTALSTFDSLDRDGDSVIGNE